MRWSALYTALLCAGCITGAPGPDPPLPPLPPQPDPAPGAQSPAGRDGAQMAYIAPGAFLRGSAEWEIEKAFRLCERFTPGQCNIAWFETESPQRKVRLSGYWLDITEVTNENFDRCVADGACAPPDLSQCQYWDGEQGDWGTVTPSQARRRFGQPQQPVVCVTWDDATNYCQWSGKRLPTEAEWEKAARGPKGQTFPWGEEDPTCESANMDSETDGGMGCGTGTTLPVGSLPTSRSPYGIMDMAGNVFEWVQDYDDGTFYIHSPVQDPVNNQPAMMTVETDGVSVTSPSNVRSIRGGAWNASPMLLRASNRGGFAQTGRTVYTGFRCAMSPQ